MDQMPFRLDSRVSEEFFAFLQEHEPLLNEMADEKKKKANATIHFERLGLGTEGIVCFGSTNLRCSFRQQFRSKS